MRSGGAQVRGGDRDGEDHKQDHATDHQHPSRHRSPRVTLGIATTGAQSPSPIRRSHHPSSPPSPIHRLGGGGAVGGEDVVQELQRELAAAAERDGVASEGAGGRIEVWGTKGLLRVPDAFRRQGVGGDARPIVDDRIGKREGAVRKGDGFHRGEVARWWPPASHPVPRRERTAKTRGPRGAPA